MAKSRNILIIVEGEKTDFLLMERLLKRYGISESHNIVSYNTNIYVLYNKMFENKYPEDFNLLSILKENEKDLSKKEIFDRLYTDIILVFDLDPQDPNFSPNKIRVMQEYFSESTDMGKLYINYPMVESFYNVKQIPDEKFNYSKVSLSEVEHYKQIVNENCFLHDHRKITKRREDCSSLIYQNIIKANIICNSETTSFETIDLINILNNQLFHIRHEGFLYDLCTCCFYIYDYNPNFILNDLEKSNQTSNKISI